MKTFSAKTGSVQQCWYVVDATGKHLGRLASRIALLLKGKHKPEYTPHVDVGDYIVVINADKIKVTGNKYNDKIYSHHTGFTGGIKQIAFKHLIKKFPDRIIKFAVKRMLPRNPLGRKIFSKLKVYGGNEHPHIGQNPKLLEI